MLNTSRIDLQPLPRLVFSVGAIQTLGRHVGSLRGKHAVVVTDSGLVAAGVIAPILEVLDGAGIAHSVFDGVEPNPTVDNVLAGAEVARAATDPVILAVGGGSSLDAAKAIALSAPNPGPVEDLQLGKKLEHPGLPVIAVPTTAGTGSETNMFGLITGAGKKLYIAHPSVKPAVAVLDPALTVGLPKYPTATCGMDVLTHALEALVGRGCSPYTDTVALGAIEMVATHLPRAYEDGSDLEARSQMLLASCMAAIAFGGAGLGICHGCGHPLSAQFNLPHGQTLATLLPAVMAFNMDVARAKYARAAFALGVGDAGRSEEDNARAAITAVEKLRAQVQTDRSLSDLGVSEAAIDGLVPDALADFVTLTNPKKVTAEDAAGLYRAVL